MSHIMSIYSKVLWSKELFCRPFFLDFVHLSSRPFWGGVGDYKPKSEEEGIQLNAQVSMDGSNSKTATGGKRALSYDDPLK